MQIITITLRSAHFDFLVRIAKESLPLECCAFLLGSGENDFLVHEILPMKNVDESKFSFSIEPEQLMYAYGLAEKKKLQIVGIFHSHPSKPVPSLTDVRFMEINPVVWLIYSTITNQLKGYIYDDDHVIEVCVRIME